MPSSCAFVADVNVYTVVMEELLSILDLQTALLVFSITFMAVLYLQHRPKGLPPGPAPWPIVGNMTQMGNAKKLHKTFHQLYRKYGGVYTLWFGPFPAIVISDIFTIKEALIQQSDIFSERPTWMYMFERYSKDIGLVFSTGHIWSGMRRFTAAALREFGVGKRSIEEKIQEEAVHLCQEIAKNLGKPQSYSLLFQQAVSNIVNSICFGDRFEYDHAELKELLQILEELFKINSFASAVNFWPFLRHIPGDLFQVGIFDRNMAKLRSFMDSQIRKQKSTFDPEQIRHFVDLYLLKELEGHEEGDVFSRQSMQKTLIDLFAAGTETTSTSLRWFLLYMVHYPDVQEFCYNEITKVIGGSRTPALSDRANLPYVEATICELLRHSNIGPFALPHDTKEATNLCGYRIPAHTLVFINMYSVHMNPEHWHKPEQFNPLRWIKDGKVKPNQEGFLPFSLGPRACLGESLARNEQFLFAATLLQRFRFRPERETDLPSMDGDLGITLAPPECKFIVEHR